MMLYITSLFKIYMPAALKQWRRRIHRMGMELDNTVIYTLQFADDPLIISNDKENMEHGMCKLIES